MSSKLLINSISSACLTFLLLCISSSPLYASAFSGKGGVQISADNLTYNSTSQTVEAEGNVEVIQGDTVIKTGKLTFNEAESILITSGGVEISDNENLITGEGLEYNFKDDSASIIKGKINISEGNYRLSGERIVKSGKNRYSITDCTLTTCDGPSPSWKIRSSRVDVEIGEYLFADHARLYVKGIPVFYTPWMAVPVKTERQSGLLFPTFGYSDVDGFIYKQPLFWAISRSKDLTFTLNYMSDRATGGLAEYRYARTKDSNGTINLEYMDEHSPLERKRWLASARHKEDFSSSLHGSIDLNAVSDSLFLRDYGEGSDQYTQQHLQSTAALVKNWPQYSLLTRFRYYEDFLAEENVALQTLPEIILTGRRKKIGKSPVFMQFQSRLDNFWRENNDPSVRRYSGQRIDIRPSFSIPFSPGNKFQLTPTLALRETVYRTMDHDKEWLSREMYDFNLDFALPFSRVYSTELERVKKVKHTIEPGLTYFYVPKVDQEELPLYDGIDSIGEREVLRVGIDSEIMLKLEGEGTSTYHRLLDLKIFSDYDIIESRRLLTSDTDRRKPWSDITGQLRIKGIGSYSFDSDARYNVYNDKVTYASASLKTRWANRNRLNLSYSYSNGSITGTTGINFLDAGFRIALLDSTDIAYRNRFSILDDYSLEEEFGIMTTKQCWSLALTYSRRKIPEENVFYALLTLKGLGALGTETGLFSD